MPITLWEWPSCAAGPTKRDNPANKESAGTMYFMSGTSLPFGSVLVFRVRRGASLSRQKPFDLLFLFTFLPRLRVHRLHTLDLFLIDPWKMPDEMDQLPGLPVVFARILTPGRHSGEPDSILDDVEQLSVGQRLGRRGRHVRSLGVKIPPNLRFAPPVIAVAHGAMICEMGPPFRQDLLAERNGVLRCTCCARHGQPAHGTGQCRFKRRGLISGAESAPQHRGECADPDKRNNGDNREGQFRA